MALISNAKLFYSVDVPLDPSLHTFRRRGRDGLRAPAVCYQYKDISDGPYGVCVTSTPWSLFYIRKIST